jgi:hypothetical protein
MGLLKPNLTKHKKPTFRQRSPDLLAKPDPTLPTHLALLRRPPLSCEERGFKVEYILQIQIILLPNETSLSCKRGIDGELYSRT